MKDAAVELRRLRYFVATAEEMHVGRAAERLGIAQPALSQQIKVLETSLGVRLFDRVRRGIQLTPVGEVFLAAARDTVAQADRAVEIAHAAARGERGRIEIGYVGTAMIEPYLPRLIAGFRARFPDVDLHLRHGPIQSQIEHVVDGRLDIAFIRTVNPAMPRQVRARVFSSTGLMAAVPAGHAVSQLKVARLADLAGDRFIVLHDVEAESFFGATTLAICRRAGFEPAMGLTVADIGSLIGLVAAGLGVALVPRLMRNLALQNVDFIELDDLAEKVELLMIGRRQDRSPAVRNFVALAAEVAGQEEDTQPSAVV